MKITSFEITALSWHSMCVKLHNEFESFGCTGLCYFVISAVNDIATDLPFYVYHTFDTKRIQGTYDKNIIKYLTGRHLVAECKYHKTYIKCTITYYM